MSAADPVPETKSFDAEYVKRLREENASWRTRAQAAETAYSVHLNKYPIGDLDNFHVSRAAMARAMSGGRNEGPAWNRYAKYERDWLRAEMEQKAAQGEMVSGDAGGFLAPEMWNARLFGLLRANSVLDKLPVTKVTIPARIEHMPRMLIDVTISYPGENASTTATQWTFAQSSYTARKAMALVNLSNEFIRDASDAADQFLQQEAAMALATDRDTQLLAGQGTGGATVASAPMGLIWQSTTATNFTYYPGATAGAAITTTPASKTPSYQNIAQLIAKVEVLSQFASVNVGQATVNGIIAHSQFKQTVWSSPNFLDAQQRPLWMADLNANGGFLGTYWALTNALPTTLTKGGGTNESVIIAGDWRQYVLFESLTFGYDATIYSGTSSTGFAADQTQLRIKHRYDGGPIHPEAFAILAGVLV